MLQYYIIHSLDNIKNSFAPKKMSVVLIGWNYQLLCLEVHCFVAKTEDRNGGNCDLGATTNF